MPSARSPQRHAFAYDVVIVGGGPAGLSAALVLGRACRRVLVCDRGTPRSWASHAVHGYLGRDGIDPGEFRRIARAELVRYPEVRFCRAEVTRARRAGTGFVVEVAGRRLRTSKLLLTDGPARLSRSGKAELAANGVPVIETPVATLEREGRQLTAIRFEDGQRLARRALFFDLPARGQSTLAQSLGCALTRDGAIRCGRYESTSVPGVFAAGNILRDVQLSIVAAGQGASAAFGINRSLTREDFARRATGRRRIDHPGTPASAPGPTAQAG